MYDIESSKLLNECIYRELVEFNIDIDRIKVQLDLFSEDSVDRIVLVVVIFADSLLLDREDSLVPIAIFRGYFFFGVLFQRV